TENADTKEVPRTVCESTRGRGPRRRRLRRNTDRAIDEERRERRRARWCGHRFYSSIVTDEGNEGAIPEERALL
ncbi:MAG: hypothetical protein ABEL97_13795, partial [Salinibacter sp.]